MRPAISRSISVPAVAILLSVVSGCDEPVEEGALAQPELAEVEAVEDLDEGERLESRPRDDDPLLAGVPCQPPPPDRSETPQDRARSPKISLPRDGVDRSDLEALPYVPTEEDRIAALEYSARFANPDGTVRPLSLE